MTCKHNWHFVDGLTKRIRCTKCAAMQFTYNKDELEQLTVHGQGYAVTNSNLAPQHFIFMDGGTREVMRISKDGITTNPEFPVDEGAKYVIKALESYIKALVQKEYERGVVDGRQIQVQKEVERRMGGKML